MQVRDRRYHYLVLHLSTPTCARMSLPQSLRVSITPPELELIASQQLVEIVPLISMERTAFISVSLPLRGTHRKSVRELKIPRVHMDLCGRRTRPRYRYGWRSI